MLTIICALGAAFCNASWAVMARLAGVAAPKGLSRWRTGWYLVHQPAWLVGQAFAVGVFVLSGVALYFGALAVVQPLLVVELIFTLALREFRLHDVIPLKSLVRGGPDLLGAGGISGHRSLPRWRARSPGGGVGDCRGGVGRRRRHLGGGRAARVSGSAGGLPRRRRRGGVVGGRQFRQAAHGDAATARLPGGV